MNKKEISEGNKLIAEFMSVEDPQIYSWSSNIPFWKVTLTTGGHFTNHLDYHRSWDWLMPVIEVIEAKGYVVTMEKHQCQIFDRSKKYPEGWIIDADFKDNRIENAWQAVVAFIRRLNENKQ